MVYNLYNPSFIFVQCTLYLEYTYVAMGDVNEGQTKQKLLIIITESFGTLYHFNQSY